MTVSVTVMELKNRAGMSTGYVINYSVLTQMNNILGKALVDSTTLDATAKDAINRCFNTVGSPIDNFTVVKPRDALKDGISEDVAAIDGKDIDLARKEINIWSGPKK